MRLTKHPILENGKKEVVSFRFNEQELTGFAGEMVSSALLANGHKTFSIHSVGNAPQGLFCANGQCAQCSVIIDGLTVKSCITPLRAGMEIKTLIHKPSLPKDDTWRPASSPQELQCDVLIAGAGPAGITSALELTNLGLDVILVDDKDRLGGKLVLQTHKFFGSMVDCYAGTRGHEISKILAKEALKQKNLKILLNSTVAGIYSDQKAGIYNHFKETYSHIFFAGLIVATGARERSLLFPGNTLPGVYGAGAFQTLVNRDLVKSSNKVLIVGAGNVGLIGAYHALQAGIDVVGILDIAPQVSGYKVHADKIQRMGVPLYLNHTLLSVHGEGRVETATIAQVDQNLNPIIKTAKTFAVDTVLIAVGLSSADEFYQAGQEGGFPVLKTGDASEIAEASSAMMGGRIIGLEMAKLLGHKVDIPPKWHKKAEILKSLPGKTYPRAHGLPKDGSWRPLLHCYEEIPCNPCTTVCPYHSIQLNGKTDTMMDLPQFSGKCIGCGLCVLICPGLAITLVRKGKTTDTAELVLPHEFEPNFAIGEFVQLRDLGGNSLQEGLVQKIRFNKKHRTYLIHIQVPAAVAMNVVGILVQDPQVIKPLPEAHFTQLSDQAIVCRCEHISLGEIKKFIKENKVEDLNQLKLPRVAMGACGGKTCLELLPRILVQAGVNSADIHPATFRPLSVEIPLKALANQGGAGS